MGINHENYKAIVAELSGKATLVAVSKTKPVEDIQALYDLGQRDFGENYVQELVEKQAVLPQDTRWHFIGHLQTNKVKYIAPFVTLIHGVESFKLLQEINKQGIKNNRVIECLLQVFIASEETKFGLDEEELSAILQNPELVDLHHVKISGLMGMASFTPDKDKVKAEFSRLKALFDRFTNWSIGSSRFTILSMGMSADYQVALEEGSNMVRIGSLLFGERQ